ncbi:MAG: hypothetical protein ACI9VN_001761, partial [Patescibacteria group bacterium]
MNIVRIFYYLCYLEIVISCELVSEDGMDTLRIFDGVLILD